MKRYQRKDGYVLVYKDRKVQYEHRLALEKKLKRKLRPDEVAHHINGSKSDNRKKNLKAKTRADHSRDHRPQAVSILCTCTWCGGSFCRLKRDLDEAARLGRVATYCSRRCGALAQKGGYFTHGTKSAYDYHKCRCSTCKAGNAERAREYRARR